MYTKLILLLLCLCCIIVPLTAATVSGFVTNQKNGEPVAYASVIINQTEQGITTNKKGYYVLTIKHPGNYSLTANLKGYKSVEKQIEIITASDAIVLNFELTRKAVEMQKFRVTGKNITDEPQAKEIQVSRVVQTPQEILDLPSVGEADVFRALATLPGVAPISDYSSGLYVRGGSPDQNLILLDNIDVYNPSHFGGIFSTFNTDAIDNVELLKGGFPATYGGRLSSVLNISNRDGDRKEFHGTSRTSIIASSMTLEGPWHAGETGGSYMGSFRRTYFDILKEALDLPDYYFYDGHAKVNWDIRPTDKLSSSVYFGKDVLKMDIGTNMEIVWGNSTYTTQWIHIFNPQFFSHFIVAGSQFYSLFKLDYAGGDNFKRDNTINDFSVKGNFSYQKSEEHSFDFGFDNKYNDIRFKNTTSAQFNPDQLPNIKATSTTSSIYFQDNWNPNVFWTILPGLRLSSYNTIDLSLKKSPSASYTDLSPRLSIRRKIDTKSQVYINLGRYYQYLVSLGVGESSPMDIWMPLDGTIKPGKSDHYILGYKNDFAKGLGIDIEGYYKTYKNLVEYRIETDNDWDNNTMALKDVMHQGIGYTFGTDWLLRTDWRGWKGFVGYTFGVTKRKMDDMNYDPITNATKYYYPKYDRTHHINIVENYYLTENTGTQILHGDAKIGVNFTYGTGQPTSKPEQVFFDGEHFNYIYSYADGDRLPAYQRFDISFKLEYIHKTWSIEPYLQIINLFNQKNVYFRNYLVKQDETTGNISLKAEDEYMFPRIPFIGFNVKW